MDFNTYDYEESVFNAEEMHGNGDYVYTGELSDRWLNELLWNLEFMIYSLSLLKQVYSSSPIYRSCVRISFKIKTETKQIFKTSVL